MKLIKIETEEQISKLKPDDLVLIEYHQGTASILKTDRVGDIPSWAIRKYMSDGIDYKSSIHLKVFDNL